MISDSTRALYRTSQSSTCQIVAKWLSVAFVVIGIVLGIFGGGGFLANAEVLSRFVSMHVSVAQGLSSGAIASLLAGLSSFSVFMYKRKGHDCPNPQFLSSLPTKTQVVTECEKVETLLTEVWQLLNAISFVKPKLKDSQVEILYKEAINKLYDKKGAIDHFCRFPPLENDKKSMRVPLLVGRIESLRFYVKQLEWRYEKQIIETNGGYESPVQSNGDCLFECFTNKLSGKKTPLFQTIPEARAQTVQWIQENYLKNSILQCFLIESMYEHYEALQARSANECFGQVMALDDESTFRELNKKQAAAYKAKLDILTPVFNQIPGFIFLKGGKIEDLNHHQEEFFKIFEPVLDLVAPYLEEMSKQGTHGGAAELYAMSTIAEACVYVYRSSNDKKISQQPIQKINAKYEGSNLLEFVQSGNHYNPWERENPQLESQNL